MFFALPPPAKNSDPQKYCGMSTCLVLPISAQCFRFPYVTQLSLVPYIMSVSDKPRFGHDHARRVHIWAGKTHNITCHVHAYPLPEIEWWRGDRKLANNQTFHVFVANTHSNLQVRPSVSQSVCLSLYDIVTRTLHQYSVNLECSFPLAFKKTFWGEQPTHSD